MTMSVPPSSLSPSTLRLRQTANIYLVGLPGVYAVLDISNPRVFLQRVDGFQDVLAPIFHLWKQPNTAVTHRAPFRACFLRDFSIWEIQQMQVQLL